MTVMTYNCFCISFDGVEPPACIVDDCSHGTRHANGLCQCCRERAHAYGEFGSLKASTEAWRRTKRAVGFYAPSLGKPFK